MLTRSTSNTALGFNFVEQVTLPAAYVLALTSRATHARLSVVSSPPLPGQISTFARFIRYCSHHLADLPAMDDEKDTVAASYSEIR